MANIFISYASADSTFALQLTAHLESLGYVVWIDRREIVIGASLLTMIGEGIDQADYLIVILSKNTLTSVWVEQEWQVKYCEEITQGKKTILPVIIEDCPIPPFLRPKRFADFRHGYEVGFAQLATTLHLLSVNSPTSLYAPRKIIRDAPTLPTPLVDADAPFCYDTGMFGTQPRLTEISVELGIPYIGKIAGLWKPDEEEQRAAWELYIELVTRVTVVELQQDEGLLREGLSSFYMIFTITRDILRKYGPSIARPKHGSDLSLGYLAINILNFVLRPVLAKWHPLLLDYEYTRNPAISAFEHERLWERAAELRLALHDTRVVLGNYTRVLAQVADIPHHA